MEKIRLIIWDLDETFWKGTLSEGEVEIPNENIERIKHLVDRGIMSSICSKNNLEPVKEKLQEFGLWDYFIFPSVSWNPKGPEVKAIVDKVKLRPETILFIDDNTTNLNEVKFFVPNINVSTPEIISTINDENPLFAGKDDSSHSRLKQYKVLEAKVEDEKQFADNHDFLRHSNIRVKVITDLSDYIDRIFELNQRTNQLNFTKNRQTIDEIKAIVADNDYNKGVVEVEDNYGKYGIVGFFAYKNNRLEHFYFSCRTIGLGIEQWIYAELGFPQLEIQGEVAVDLNTTEHPDWINQTVETVGEKKQMKSNGRMLLMGGCDLEQVAYYLEQTGIDFVTQFNYVMANNAVCHPEAFEYLRGSQNYTEEEKRLLIDKCNFLDDTIFNNRLTDGTRYDAVVFSPVIEMAIGVYEFRKNRNLKVLYGNFDNPRQQGIAFMSPTEYDAFEKDFEFIGHTTIERFKENLEMLRQLVGENTPLIILNASEFEIQHPTEPDRHLLHKEMNQVIAEFVSSYNNVELIDVNGILKGKSDHADTIRHYKRDVYFKISQQILKLLTGMGFIKEEDYVDVNYTNREITMKMRVKTILRQLGLLKYLYRH